MTEGSSYRYLAIVLTLGLIDSWALQAPRKVVELMKLQEIKCVLLKDLRRKEGLVLFEQARNRNSALTHYNTPSSVLTALGDTLDNTYSQKEKLTRALIREQQSRPRPFWSSLLITAYLPMLIRLRTQIIGNIFPSDDLDQLVIYSFLEVIHQFPLSKWQDYTCVRLSHQTRRRVFRELKRETRYRCLLDRRSPDDLTKQELEDRYLGEDQRPKGCEPENINQLADLFIDAVNDAIELDKVKLVVATKIHGEDLRHYIKRNGLELSASTEEQNYQRLKRQRSRVLARLRESCVLSSIRASSQTRQYLENEEI